MHADLNLNDLTRLGIPESMVAQCFAQKGITVTQEDLSWMRKSFMNNSIIDTKETVQELPDQPLRTNGSFVSINDQRSLPNESLMDFQKNETRIQFRENLQNLHVNEVLEAQKLILEFSESVFNSRNLGELKSFELAIQGWMKIFREKAENCYWFLDLHLKLYLFLLEKSEIAFLKFHELKSEILVQKLARSGPAKEQNELISSEKLAQSLEVLDQELTTFMQKQMGSFERIHVRDFSNVGFVRELHFGEFLKVGEISLGSGHILWSCMLQDRRVLFGMGDNSHGQIIPNLEIKHVGRPILLGHLKEKQIQKFQASADISCALDSENLFIWGKTLDTMVEANIPSSVGKIEKICQFGTSVVLFTTENKAFFSSLKRANEFKEIGKFSGKITQISAGTSHMVMLMDSGKLYGFGSNKSHQLSDSKSKTEFNFLEEIENVSCDPILAVFCYNDMTMFLDNSGGCFLIGKVNSKKEIRYAESLELYETPSTFKQKMGMDGSCGVIMTGNDKRVVVCVGNDIFEWTCESSLKFKPKTNDSKTSQYRHADFRDYRLSRFLEFVEFRAVFGPNCELTVKNEKIKKNEQMECQIVFRDAQNQPFKSQSEKDFINVLLTKTGDMANKNISNQVSFNSVLHTDSGVEIRNASLVDIGLKNVRWSSPTTLEFEAKCVQAGLYMLQIHCNGNKTKGEFLMEILRSGEIEEKADSLNRSSLNTFLTGSSFKSLTTNVQPVAEPPEVTENQPVALNLHPVKAKLKPIDGELKSIFVNKQKRPGPRFSSIKLKKSDDTTKSILEERFPGKIITKLPPMPDAVLNSAHLKFDRLVFKKGDKKLQI